MKTQKYIFAFAGTTMSRDKVSYVDTFYVIADNVQAALLRVQDANKKIVDFEAIDYVVACNNNW